MPNYDNRGYNSGYSNNRSSGGQNRPSAPTQGYQRSAPAEILPEKVPEDYVDRAEAIMRELCSPEHRGRITTSKIRNLLSLISDVYNMEKLRTKETELTPESISKLSMMRVRTAYESGRDPDVAEFVRKAKLLQYLKGIETDRKDCIRFANYMEALVAYHRYFGGKD